ncbi:MAG: phosphoenolpyruvate--protein phosphotransferase [Epulopiscium sp.]|nr:phosphoenolpyruvate--protein phosphotransferase [Candidatus Epulonipiscium sp.]
MMKLRGIGASKGIAIGKVLIKKQCNITTDKKSIQSIDNEMERLEDAKKQAIEQLKQLQDNATKNIGESEARIFEVHQMILQDEDFMGRAKEIIQNEAVNAEYAVSCTGKEYSSLFKEMEDPYMRERAADIVDISKRLLELLTNQQDLSLSELTEPVIIAAKDLLPSDTVKIDQKKVLGFILEEGGKMSHSSILARTMKIPAIVGVQSVLSKIQDGDEVILDGENGYVMITPNSEVKNEWLKKQKEYKIKLNRFNQLKGTKSITKDGVVVKVNANIGMPEDVDAAIENDAEGIGLFRSEFLYMNSKTMPSEEKQFKAYKTVLEKMKDKMVIIRTLDVGGDKEIAYLQIPKESNPFLGYRAIRICLDKTDLFKTQLRALLRASIYGKLGIMFPMICTLEEVQKAKKILEEVKKSLQNEKIPFSEDIEIGIMIETPAAAMISDILAKEVDFFSIGTNDLTQYTIAVDRMNSQVAYLYNTHHLSVLRLIQKTIENGHKENIWVGICGEAAADPTLTKIFVAMGIDELSVNSGSVLEIRQMIQNINKKESKAKLKI